MSTSTLPTRPTVRSQRRGPVTIITIDRPAQRNAVDLPTANALHAAFVDFDADDTSAVAILTGAGGTFCAGADLKAFGTPRQNRLEPTGPGPMGLSRLILSKPVIAAIEGFAVAGGLELAIWCDLRVAADDAIFGVFCRRFGVPLIDGGTVRLPRLIGQSRALDMILTGRPVDTAEALSFGLVNRIAAPGAALDAAMELADHLASRPQRCLRSDRASALSQWGLPEAEALSAEFDVGMATLDSGESALGAARFRDGEGRAGRVTDE